MDDDKQITARQGFFAEGKGRSRISVDALRVGMYVVELDVPWEDTPFLFQGFEITSVNEIEEVARYTKQVVVEFKNDTWVPPVKRDAAGKRKSKQPPRPTTASASSLASMRELQTEAKSLTRSMMEDVQLGRAINVKEIKTTVSACVSGMLKDPDAMMWLSRIRSRDQYTSEHSLNVGLLAIGFARHLGYGVEDLNTIGIAGMLHDVGKMRTPLEVLNKEGKLTPEEYEQMKAHTIEGRDILMAHSGLYSGTVDVAYGHHEAMDGTGYPRQIKAAGISEFTRIVTLADVYDAMTSDRCYKTGCSSLTSLQWIKEGAGVKYDPGLAEEFVKHIGLYPPGSLVELRSSAMGIVVNTNHRNRHLPRVLLVRDENGEPCEERIIDLQKLIDTRSGMDMLIRDLVPNGKHGVRVEEFIQKGLQLR